MLAQIGNGIFQVALVVAALGANFPIFLIVLPPGLPGHEAIALVILPLAISLVGWGIKCALEALDLALVSRNITS